MPEIEKKLEDYYKENHIIHISYEDFKKMSYLERVQLYNESPETYENFANRGRMSQPKRPTGCNWTSQIRYDD